MIPKYKEIIERVIDEVDSTSITSNLFQNEKNNSKQKIKPISIDKRSNVDKDFSSIVQSGYFRRLEDKTQVFALSKDNQRRTRLTHTIEVSSIGEQLGKNCADIIKRKFLTGYKGKTRDDVIDSLNSIPSVLRNACLVHDLGNPPFGHKGEYMIGDWIKKNLSKFSIYFNGRFFTFDKNIYDKNTKHKQSIHVKDLQSLLQKENLFDDLCVFEGNAQNIRILSSLTYTSRNGFSKSLFRAIGKYTCDVETFLKFKDIEKDKKIIENKKLGYFKSESFIIERLYQKFDYKRGFVAYLLEASDDIAYSISDLEDSLSKNLVDIEKLRDEIIKEFNDLDKPEREKVQNIFLSKKYNGGEFLKRLKSYPYEGSDELYLEIKTIEERARYYKNIISLIDTYLAEKKQNDEKIASEDSLYSLSNLKKAHYYRGQEAYELERIENVFRGYLISSSTEYFKYHIESLISGTYLSGSIVDNCTCNFVHNAIVKCMKKYVYNSESVRNKEIVATRIIDVIMTNLFNAILNMDLQSNYKNRSYEQFEFLLGKKHLNAYFKSLKKCSSKTLEGTLANIIYYKVRLLIDTVSAMTDSYALSVYQNMEGII